MKLIDWTRNADLVAVANAHGAEAAVVTILTGSAFTGVTTDTPERMRDILNDYCRAKIDAKNIEAGQPLWVDVAKTAQERRP